MGFEPSAIQSCNIFLINSKISHRKIEVGDTLLQSSNQEMLDILLFSS